MTKAADSTDLILDIGSLEPAVFGVSGMLAQHLPPNVSLVNIPAVSEELLAHLDEVFGGTVSPRLYGGGAVAFQRTGEDGKIFTLAVLGYLPAERVAPRFRAFRDDEGLGRLGPYAAVAGFEHAMPVLLLRAVQHLRDAGYQRAYIPCLGAEEAGYIRRILGKSILREITPQTGRKPRIVVCGSAEQDFVQPILRGIAGGHIDVELTRVIHHTDASTASFQQARELGVDIHALPWDRAVHDRAGYHRRVADLAAEVDPDLVFLLSWQYVVPVEFVQRFPELLNMHAAYLPLDPARDDVLFPDGRRAPALRGNNAIRDALHQGFRQSGISVHRVTENLDRGEILTRALMQLPALAELEQYNWFFAPHHQAEILRALDEALYGGINTWIAESWG